MQDVALRWGAGNFSNALTAFSKTGAVLASDELQLLNKTSFLGS